MDDNILESAKAALKALMDDAELRSYNPPVPSLAVAELEWIISKLERRSANVA